jgi:hypothetical protein
MFLQLPKTAQLLFLIQSDLSEALGDLFQKDLHHDPSTIICHQGIC